MQSANLGTPVCAGSIALALYGWATAVHPPQTRRPDVVLLVLKEDRVEHSAWTFLGNHENSVNTKGVVGLGLPALAI